MDFIISLVVILIFVAASLKKSGQLDEIMNGMKKKKQNEADSVVYEQTEDMPKKKKAKAKKGGGVPRNLGKGVGIAGLRQLLHSFRGRDGCGHHLRKAVGPGGVGPSL